MRPTTPLILALLGLPLVACTDDAAQPAAAPAAAPAPAPAAAPPPSPVDPGLIANAAFAPAETGRPPARWTLGQHAGAPSYQATAEDGQMVIRRIGDEPWGLASQRLDATALAGKTLSFSMELSGTLDETRGPALQPAGLVVKITGFGPKDPPMLGRRHLLTLNEEPGLAAGTHPWARHELRFQVPEGKHLELTVGVQLTMDGELRARAPSLVVLEPAATR